MKDHASKKPFWRLDEKAFWPNLRADTRNTARVPRWQNSRFRHDIKWPKKPWAFRMGKATTCAPVVGADGTTYLGSGDKMFYAIQPDGTLKWKFETGNVVDDAAVIARRTDPETGEEQDYVFFPGADGFARKMNCTTGECEGAFEATEHHHGKTPFGVPKCNWFESDFTFSKDGVLLAGNDDFAFYQLDPETMEKAYPEFLTKNMIWTGSPTGPDGERYLGSLDTIFRCISKEGKLKWWYPVWGTCGGPPTVLQDGAVIVGSGNNNVYCFKRKGFLRIGRARWRFHTMGDVWSSAALSPDETIAYISSSDGVVYALHVEDGTVEWTFSTTGPNRCGCVVDGEGNVFIASGDGKIYKLSGKDGHRIWSYDCRKFNTNRDLGEWERCHFVPSSIALSPGGVHAGNQNGNLYFIPHVYMESGEARSDPNCCFDPNPDWPANGTHLFFVSPGGRVIFNITDSRTGDIHLPKPQMRGNVLFFQLALLQDHQLQDARIIDTEIISNHDLGIHAEISTDARFINIVPGGLYDPGKEYNFTLRVKYIIPKRYGWPILRLDRHWRGVKRSGEISRQVKFTTEEMNDTWDPTDFPLRIGDPTTKIPGDMLVIKNVFPWQEALIMNLGIIALDDLNIISTPIYHDPKRRRIIFWNLFGEKIEGLEHDADGSIASYAIVPEPEYPFLFPLDMTYDTDGTFILHTAGFKLHWAGVTLPFEYLNVSGRLSDLLSLERCSTAYFKTPVKKIPLFGRILKYMNVKNERGEFIVGGTIRVEKAKGPATEPSTAAVRSIEFEDGMLVATLERAGRFMPSEHIASIALIDATEGISIKQDYENGWSYRLDDDGAVVAIEQVIDEDILKTYESSTITAFVLMDATPVASKQL
ncbi:PQQ-binding-like beta-propeller repeat protein [Candidatus Bathyarchaeota archaeon]|nr:PQQ-binding-like beta-propeller repeat protein [Candidatus Bathyarchaeota archaeon]